MDPDEPEDAIPLLQLDRSTLDAAYPECATPPAASSPMLASASDPHLPPTPSSSHVLPPSLTTALYTSHLLSTWNSRVFEFGAVLFLADLFPASLLPLSVYALLRSAAVVIGAQAVGDLVDDAARQAGRNKRLRVVKGSILGGRGAVVGSCAVLVLLGWVKAHREREGKGEGGCQVVLLFAVLTGLACVEKLCATLNLVAVERDWVVVMTEGDDAARRALNAKMRRIDLLCKLLGPLAVASIAVLSTRVTVWATLGMNIASVVPELVCITHVYENIPSLQQSSTPASDPDDPAEDPTSPTTSLKSTLSHILPLRSLPYYFHHQAFLPSFSLCLLYLTVLSLSGQMMTYLLSLGFTPFHVGVIRFVATIFELSATWIAPLLMRRIGVVRGAMWSLSWQMVWLAAGVGWFFHGSGGMGEGVGKEEVVKAAGLVVGVVVSRVGLWSYDLCAQSIIQEEVEGDHRGSFSTVEAAFQNLFELASYATTVVFSRPDQFRWPVVISVAAVYVAGGLYASFVRQRRGHLFHPPACICLEKGQRGEVT